MNVTKKMKVGEAKRYGVDYAAYLDVGDRVTSAAITIRSTQGVNITTQHLAPNSTSFAGTVVRGMFLAGSLPKTVAVWFEIDTALGEHLIGTMGLAITPN